MSRLWVHQQLFFQVIDFTCKNQHFSSWLYYRSWGNVWLHKCIISTQRGNPFSPPYRSKFEFNMYLWWSCQKCGNFTKLRALRNYSVQQLHNRRIKKTSSPWFLPNFGPHNLHRPFYIEVPQKRGSFLLFTPILLWTLLNFLQSLRKHYHRCRHLRLSSAWARYS